MSESKPSIWDRVDPDLVVITTIASSTETSEEEKQERKEKQEERKARWRRRRRVVDTLAVVFWLYLFTKVFVSDIDGELLDALGIGWLSDYRFFVFLGLLALAVVALPKGSVIGGLIYIALFPLVVLFWKIPKAIYRTKSWVVVLAAVNVITGLFFQFKYRVLALAAGAGGVLCILAFDQPATIAVGMVALIVLLVVSFVRIMWFTIVPARFLSDQEQAIDGALESDLVKRLAVPQDALLYDEIEPFTAEQQLEFVNNLSWGVVVHRALYFWAYSLDVYRKSSASLFFGTLGYFGLVLQTVATFALLNFGLFKIDAEAFAGPGPSNLLSFARYSITTFYGGEIAAIQPQSDVANALALAGLLAGLILAAGVVVAGIQTLRERRQDAAIGETVDKVKARGRAYEEEFRARFEISIPEAIERLRQMEAGLLGLITSMSKRIPPEFEGGDGSPNDQG